jgi:hypothetical protein
MRKQAKLLDHIPDIPFQRYGVPLVDVFVVDVYLAAVWFYQAVDHLKERRFPATGRADQYSQLTLFDGEAKVPDDWPSEFILMTDVLKLNNSH